MTQNEVLTLKCINLYLSILGVKEDITNIKNTTKESNNFNDELKKIQTNNKVNVVIKRSKTKNINNITTPVILFDAQGLPFILAKANKESCLIQNPNKESPEVIPYDKINSIWNKSWLEIKQPQSRFDITWFIPEFLQHKRILGEVFLFSFVLQILALISPLFFQVVMDKVLVHQAWSTLDVLVIGLVITGIVEVILRGLREYQYAHTANRIDIQLGLKLVKHLFGLPLMFFKTRQVGAIVTRVRELRYRTRVFDRLDVYFNCRVLVHVCLSLRNELTFTSTLTLLFIATIPLYVLLAWWLTPRMQVGGRRAIYTCCCKHLISNRNSGWQ